MVGPGDIHLQKEVNTLQVPMLDKDNAIQRIETEKSTDSWF